MQTSKIDETKLSTSRISGLIVSVVAEYFEGQVYEKLASRAAMALRDEGCDDPNMVARFCHVMCESIQLRSDSQAYKAHTLVGIIAADADQWRLIVRHNPEDRAQRYDAHRSTPAPHQVQERPEPRAAKPDSLETQTNMFPLPKVKRDAIEALVGTTSEAWRALSKIVLDEAGAYAVPSTFDALWIKDNYEDLAVQIFGEIDLRSIDGEVFSLKAGGHDERA